MATLETDGDELVLRLTTRERWAALRPGDVRVPRSTITRARTVESAYAEVRGLRAPGTAWPGVIRVGTWRGFGSKSFVAVHGRGPGSVIELDGGPYDRLIVSAPLPEGL